MNPLRLLTKEELLRAIWPDSFVEEGNLTQNIFLLRKALTPDGEDVRYIVTIPGRGYQFGSTVEIISQSPRNEPDLSNLSTDRGMELSAVHSTMRIVVHEEVDDGSPSISIPALESERTRGALPGSFRRSRERWFALGGFLLVALGIGSYFWWRAHRQPISNQTIVLADFDNRTGDATFDRILRRRYVNGATGRQCSTAPLPILAANTY
jgi:eukaryotic-like serine/threonine-protein kinase